jgi:hypothetical protein
MEQDLESKVLAEIIDLPLDNCPKLDTHMGQPSKMMVCRPFNLPPLSATGRDNGALTKPFQPQ